MSYTIMINEEQRLALLGLLQKNGEPPALIFWEDMLDCLPEDEAETPGVLHGFCL